MESINGKLNQIVENRFYGNSVDVDPNSLGNWITSSKYIVCLKNGLWGLKPEFERTTNKFIGFIPLDIGSNMKCLDQKLYSSGKFEFVNCGFHVVDDTITLFVVFKEIDNEKYHYVYFNENCHDELYGLVEINDISLDQLVVRPQDVFKKVEATKQLDDIAIALTDYGFWDIEQNTTRTKTYSYRRNTKNYLIPVQEDHIDTVDHHKLLRPYVNGIDGTTSKVVQYDKVWQPES